MDSETFIPQVIVGDFTQPLHNKFISLITPTMNKLLIFILIGLLAFMTFVAWHNSQPLDCVQTRYESGRQICEVVLQ